MKKIDEKEPSVITRDIRGKKNTKIFSCNIFPTINLYCCSRKNFLYYSYNVFKAYRSKYKSEARAAIKSQEIYYSIIGSWTQKLI